MYKKVKKLWKYKDRLCYNGVSQKELFIQEEVRGWYHLPISSKINLEYMQGPDCFLCRKPESLRAISLFFKGTDSGDAKRMFCVMNLAVKQGDQITVHVEGENEEADAEVMREFLKNNL